MTTHIKRPKVLHIITGLKTGGAEQALHNLLAHGLNQRYENRVISLTQHGYFSDKIAAHGIVVDAIKLSPKTLFSSLNKLKQLAKDFQPDIIQGWMYHGNLAALYASKFTRKNIPVLWNIRHSLHGIANEKTTTAITIRLNKYYSNKATAIIYNSQVSRQQHQDFGVKNTHSLIHANGFDTTLFNANAEHKKLSRDAYKIESNKIVVGNVARFHPMKNHTGMIRTAVKICSERNDVTFILAGKDVNYENGQLKNLIPETSRDSILLIDEVSNMSSLMNAFDIYVQSSQWGEAFPNALAEAMATNVYCLATDIGDSSMIIADTGLVFDDTSDDCIYQGIKKAIDMAPNERLKKGCDARNRVKQHFSIQSSIDMYANTYENLINKGSTS